MIKTPPLLGGTPIVGRRVEPVYVGDVGSEILRGVLRGIHPFDSHYRHLAVMYLYGERRDRPPGTCLATWR